MSIRRIRAARGVLLAIFLLTSSSPAVAQRVEVVGVRALGLGGAFVAVADDSSATWWNPAGLAAGPFLDVALSHARVTRSEDLPARRDRMTGFALGTPPFGFSVFRLQVTQTPPLGSTGAAGGDREHRLSGTAVRALSLSQVGVTVLRTLFTGVHAGTTLKYVRGTFRDTVGGPAVGSAADLLDAGASLDGGDARGHVDLDAGVLIVTGPLRLGGVVRNLREPVFESRAGAETTLPRQIRVGVAFDATAAGGPPLMVAFDADLRAYETGQGRRRVLAVGAEHWLFERRVGLRAGFRGDTVGDPEPTATVGGSVALRPGLYVDGYAAGGASTSDRGWGVAGRVSF